MENKINEISLEEELLSFWLQGWSDYALNPYDDYPAIRQLAVKICNQVKADSMTPEGHSRVCNAILKMATHCKYTEKWASKNLHFYNIAFQTLYNEMRAKKRFDQIRSGNYNYNK